MGAADPQIIESLAAQIRHHRARYYNSEEPEITDDEFDALEDRLRAMAPDHPVLGEVGAPPPEAPSGAEVEAAAAEVGHDVSALATELLERNAGDYDGRPSDPRHYLGLYVALSRAQPDHPALSLVTPPRGMDWPKARHELPMGSLNKVNTVSELEEWAARCDQLATEAGAGPISGDLIVTEKLDGLSLELVYEDGALVAAITRGDGLVGERITANVAKMQGVPAKIPHRGRISARGEIVLKKSDGEAFTRFKKQVDPRFVELKSLRNSAAGIARTKEPKLLPGCRLLTVLCYDLEGIEGQRSEREKLEFLSAQGFEQPAIHFGDVTQVVAEWKRYEGGARKALPYDIDGLVVRANDLTAAALLGELNNRPRGAVAFKFGNEMAVTTLKEVLWSTGDTGRITPIAQLDPPVFLAGAEVRQASLHNVAKVRSMGIGSGDQVLVSRRNDVIPYVEKVVVSAHHPEDPPASCKICQAPVSVEGEYLLCRNEDCPAKRTGRLKTWVDQLGLLDWGEVVVQQLFLEGLAKEPADLYRLQPEQVANLKRSDQRSRFGAKVAAKLLDPLNAQKEIPLPTFIAALGIETVSKETAKLLVNAGFESPEAIAQANKEDLAQIPGLGEIKAEKILSGLRARLPEIQRLREVGVIPVKPSAGGPLAGLSFCFSGASDRPRKVLEGIVEKNGGTAASSVTKGVTYLVLADPASTSTKAQKAKKLGTEIISEEAFIALVEERGGAL